jgi:hypothetical protein
MRFAKVSSARLRSVMSRAILETPMTVPAGSTIGDTLNDTA